MDASGAGDRELRTIDDVIDRARAVLPADVWNYVAGGSGTEATLRRNREAWDALALRPRVLVDVSRRDATSSFLGQAMALPLMLAPIGGIGRVHPSGAEAVAKAAETTGTVAFVSVNASHTLEAVRDAAPSAALVFQIYAYTDERISKQLVDRARSVGCLAICVTVDTQVYGRRERDIRSGFSGRGGSSANYMGMTWSDVERAAATWDDVARIRQETDLPMIIKGVMTVEDLERSLAIEPDAVCVSNHGGRQLDQGQATAEVLPAMAAAGGDQVPLLVDGGILHGEDVLKALALGAAGVLIGRLGAWGLAAGGAAGLIRTIEILEAEIETGLGLLGCVTPGDVAGHHVTAARGSA